MISLERYIVSDEIELECELPCCGYVVTFKPKQEGLEWVFEGPCQGCGKEEYRVTWSRI